MKELILTLALCSTCEIVTDKSYELPFTPSNLYEEKKEGIIKLFTYTYRF